jgi:Holliday junction resolvase RusA-like endonuclease/endogenous inhibitor of DNA gyrase (YacG/DUF329 family)
MNTGDAHTEAAWFGLAREHTDYPVVARFTVDGEPESKNRARWSPHGGRPYTPERTRAAEAKMAWRFKEAARGYEPSKAKSYGVVGLFFAATRQRRDVDNMLKLICDALNGLAWADDSQVNEIAGRKVHVTDKGHARTEVLIYELPPVPPATVPCTGCTKPLQTYPSWKGGRRFCSIECRTQYRQPAPTFCQTCGQPTANARKFCSTECQHQGRRVVQPCTVCGTDVERFTSWAKNRPFCSAECRSGYWREHRAIAAKGTCATCGGSTSKKTYTRCRACVNAGVRLDITPRPPT